MSSGSLHYGGNALEVKRLPISTSATATIVAAVVGKRIRVISLVVTASAAVNVKFQSHGGTDLTGLLYLGQNGGIGLSRNQDGYFQTVSGEALDINLSSSVAVGGFLTYVEV